MNVPPDSEILLLAERSPEEECEGYLKLKSGTLDLAMREKFCRLSGTSFLYYASAEAYKVGLSSQSILVPSRN